MLTSTGRWVLAFALTLLLLGWILDYPELVVVGLGLAAALLVAIAYLGRRSRVEVVRFVSPLRVTEGEQADGVLRATNVGRSRSAPLLAVERVGSLSLAVRLPSLSGEEAYETRYELPAERRGVYSIGPLSIGHSDPFRLAGTSKEYGSVLRLFVHPRTSDVAPVPNGRSRELEGATSVTAPRGGVAFHSLREYVRGDDVRLIDWKSTAKTGTLMVRHNVVATEPRLMIVLDMDPESYPSGSFDDAVRVAGSLMRASVNATHPTELRTTTGDSVDISPRGESMLSALDLLSAVQLEEGNAGLEALARVDVGARGVSLCVVTGTPNPARLSILGAVRSRFDLITLVAIGESRYPLPAIAGALMFSADDAEEFTTSWNRRFAR